MEFFLFMTFSASLLILTALLLRPLTGKLIPRVTQMILWIAASLRLLLPVQIPSPLGFLGRTPAKTDIPKTGFGPSAGISAEAPVLLPDISAPPVGISPVKTVASLSIWDVLLRVWLFGTVLTAAVLLCLHLRELYRCRNMRPDPDAKQYVPGFVRVFRCRLVGSPFTAGVFRPRILLPENLPASDLPAVLAHECAHIRGLDILKKYLFAAALCVNWFNPLVWLMVRLAGQDLEILCDARALRHPDAPDTKTYAHALLNTEERRTLFTLGFKSNTEVRIMKILKKENINRFTLCISILLVSLLITACTTTQAAGIQSGSTPEPEAKPESSHVTDEYLDTPESEVEPESSQVTDEYVDEDYEITNYVPESNEVMEEYMEGYWETTKPGSESSQTTEEYVEEIFIETEFYFESEIE